MALKDNWKDLKNAVEGFPDSGDDISVKPINDIAHAVIELEENENIVTDTAPYIGDNGNWYIYDISSEKYIDSGMPSRGEKGDKGDNSDPIGKLTPEGGTILGDLENNHALAPFTTAIGKELTAGSKGFYIQSVDTVNKKIYLSLSKVEASMSSNDNTNTEFETPGYEIGDEFSVLAITESGESHYHFCSKIVEVNNNVITYDNELPFTKIVNDADEEFPVFTIPSKPTIGSVVIGEKSFSEGESNISTGRASHAEGRGNIAAGKYAHAEGRNTRAGYAAHAEGLSTKAYGMYSHAEGQETEAIAKSSHAEGYMTKANGTYSHAEGFSCIAHGSSTHAEGDCCNASGYGSHAEGYDSYSGAQYAHAEGNGTMAIGQQSHSEGWQTTASGTASHAEGYLTSTDGTYCHAEGARTLANGYVCHAEGYETTASGQYQHVQGTRNIVDRENKYAHIVGNGTANNARSNAHTLDWDGNAWFAGVVTTGRETTDDDDDLVVVTKGYLKEYVKRYVEEAILGGAR